MKISKLFHWLYAFLMLLPVFGVLFKVGYVMFNDNAFESYNGSYTYQGYVDIEEDYLTLLSSDISMINGVTCGMGRTFLNTDTNWVGNFNFILNASSYNGSYTNFAFPNISNVYFNNEHVDSNLLLFSRSAYNVNDTILKFYFVDSLDVSLLKICDDSFMYNGSRINPIFTFNVTDNGCNLKLKKDNSYILSYYWHPSARPSTMNLNLSSLAQTIKVLSFITDTTLSSVFYSSLQEINNTEFFSWAKDSFLVQPIMYIGNLFGIANPHPIFTFMSYWLSISIIWLVFDLVMYLPLLVHRWLDKGVIE